MTYIKFHFFYRLEIKQASEGSHHVPGIVEAKVCSIKEVWSVMQAGSNARAIGSNHVNEHSSRSHWYLSLHFLLFCFTAKVGFFFFLLLTY